MGEDHSASFLTQKKLEHKFLLFLNTLGEQYQLGICNGFAFMNFRADFIGKQDEHLSRMQKFTDKEDNDIREMGELYKKYKELRGLLFETDPLLSVNNQLSALQKEKKTDRTHQEKITTLKIIKYALIKTMLKEKFQPAQLEKIREAEHLYIYINTTLAAFNPDEYNYQTKGYGQKAYPELLQLLAPVDAEGSEIQVNKVFEIAFNFSEKELIDLFSDKKIIHPDDFFAIDSGNHTLYLSYRDGVFRLFDPGPIEIEGNTPFALVKAIMDRFFGLEESTDYMPIGISIFEKGSKLHEERAKAAVVIENLLATRGPHHNLNGSDDPVLNYPAVFMAARYGHVSVIQLLAKTDADLNASDSKGNTPLFVAAQNNHPKVIKELAATGRVNMNDQNNRGMSAAMIAARCDQVASIKALAENKADLNAVETERGYTPAMFAALHNHSLAIKTLYESGADLNKKNPISGQTALHIAVLESNFSAIKTLICCGADPYIQNNAYKTAMNYSYADKKIHSFIQELIELKHSFEQLKGVIELTLEPNARVEIHHTPENKNSPNLYLRVSSCSFAELTALAMTLKNYGVEIGFIQNGEEQQLAISRVVSGRISIVDLPDFQESYQSNTMICKKNCLEKNTSKALTCGLFSKRNEPKCLTLCDYSAKL